MAKLGAGLRPNVACEFKRAGFLEWRKDWNIAADRLKASGDLYRAEGWNQAVIRDLLHAGNKR